MTFGNNLQALRESQGLSQKELANQVGVSTGMIAEWESDESSPNLAELSRLSKVLDVSADALLIVTPEEVPTIIEIPTDTPLVEATSTEIPEKSPPAPSTPTKKRKKLGWIISGVAGIVVLAAVAILIFLNIPFADNTAAIEAADASVVTLFCYNYDGELTATGSGFVAFDSKTIITNYHVMTSAYTCKISTNQDISYDVTKVLCCSKEQDIAVLQVAEDTGLKPLPLGNSKAIKKGETVVAIGSPLGIKNTVSTGTLSGRLMQDNMDVLQFTAPISSGSSGGALFDGNGNVIGITYASYVNGQNLNLAIPIELATTLHQEITNAAEDVSYICQKEHPYIKYLQRNKQVPTVTLEDLKQNPKKYTNRVVRIRLHMSSLKLFGDNWKHELSNLYISNQDDVSFDHDHDLSVDSDNHFENGPYIRCWLSTCEEPNVPIQEGTYIVIVGTFVYTPAKPVDDPSSWRDYYYLHSKGKIDALYIDVG